MIDNLHLANRQKLLYKNKSKLIDERKIVVRTQDISLCANVGFNFKWMRKIAILSANTKLIILRVTFVLTN